MKSNYSKHKECSPQDTIFEIQSILNRLNLFGVLEWNPKSYDGARSNRLTLYPTRCGTNGKGTDELYSSASAHAELIERMQNNILALRGIRPALKAAGGFYDCPDEKMMTVSEILAQDSNFLNSVFDCYGLNAFERGDFLNQISSREDGTIPVVPFANLKKDCIEWLPYRLVISVCGSNGMAAGNVLEEAMVQGFSEVFERFVNIKVLNGECVLPKIPDEYLKPYSTWDLIEKIRAEGRYTVSLLDGSLGKNFPVVACVVTDKKRGTFGIKFGAHPSFAVAVERTLTEALQGRNIEEFTAVNKIGSIEESSNEINISNIMKISSGIYPTKLFTDKPSWEFKQWNIWEGLDNKSFLKKMLSILKDEGKEILVRDASHLGFATCFVVIPQMSEIYPRTPRHFRWGQTILKVFDKLSHFPNLSEEDEKRLLRIILFNRGSVGLNQLDNVFLRPVFGKRMNFHRVGGFLAFKHGNYKAAYNFFKVLYNRETDDAEKYDLNVMTEYLRYRAADLDHDEAIRLIEQFYYKKSVDRVIAATSEPSTVMQKYFPQMNCYDCENCELSGKECSNRIEEELFSKFLKEMKNTKVSQENLLEKLKGLMNE